MRKYYRYAAVFILLSFLLLCGVYLYRKYCPVRYHNGTLVELPRQTGEARELSA